MAKDDDLPPIGLPLVEPESSGYFARVTAMVVACGAAILGIGYGSILLSSGPCDELEGRAFDGLRAEIEHFRDMGAALDVSNVEVHELRASSQVARDALEACCEQQREGGSGDADFGACEAQASAIADLPAELALARQDPAAAKGAIRTAALRLRGIANELSEIANRGESVASGPPPSERPGD